MNSKDMNNFMKNAREKTGIDVEKMKQAADNGNLDDFINKNLSADASQKLKNVLTNKEAAEKLLSTPQAKELMKKLMQV